MKNAVINILTPFIYIIGLYFALPIWLLLWMPLKIIVCKLPYINNLGICINTDPYNNFYALLDLIFLLPFWIIIAIFWFIALKELNKKLKER